MGMLDRMMDRGSPLTPQTESSSSTPALDEAPVIKRMRVTTDYLLKSIARQGGDKTKAMIIMRKIMADSFNDLVEVPPDITEFYLRQSAAVLYWAATGEVVTDTPLPDDFPAVDYQGNPMIMPAERLEIESGKE